MILTPYGLRVWLPITIMAGLIAVALGVLQWWWPMGAVIVLWLTLMSFFRDPFRRPPADLKPGDMLSPADGTVSAVFEVDSHPATGGQPARIIRIFLSVLNVHINRSPFDGEVLSLAHAPGKYLNAQTEESAIVNESNLIIMRIAGDETIGIRQVSGMIARTIICPLKPGDRLTRGQKFGMIMFGSTTELILPRPCDIAVHVTKGDMVRGGRHVIATLSPLVETSTSRNFDKSKR